MSLGDLHLRAGTLSGQIKQADTDVVESTLLLARAEQRVTTEARVLAKHVASAAALREKRAALQREAHDLLGQIGEPLAVAGEGVSVSSGEGGVDAPPKPECQHETVSLREHEDAFFCNACGVRMPDGFDHRAGRGPVIFDKSYEAKHFDGFTQAPAAV